MTQNARRPRKGDAPGRSQRVSPESRTVLHTQLDPIDEMLLARMPSMATAKLPRHMRFAFYGRYSTSKQRYESIERQVDSCDLYLALLGVEDYDIFQDPAHSGMAAKNRPQLQELLSRLDEYDAVVFESFARWARESYDAVETFEALERKGVEMHCATTKRVLSKSDMLDAAKNAEADARQRAAFTSAGNRASAKLGRRRAGAYGWKKGFKPGVKHRVPDKIKVVVRICEAMASGKISAYRMARQLTEEKVPSPRHAPGWNAQTVSYIAKNPYYAARILFGVTSSSKDRRTGKRVVSRIPKSPVINVRMERYRVISDDTLAANLARSKPATGKATRGRTPKPRLLEDVACACGVKDQKFIHRDTAKGDRRWACTRETYYGSCSSPVRTFLSTPIERAVVETVNARLLELGGVETFADTYSVKIRDSAASFDERRDALTADVKRLEIELLRAARSEVSEGWKPELQTAVTEEIQRELDEVRGKLGAVPNLNAGLGELDRKAPALAAALARLVERLPFAVRDDRDAVFLGAFQRLVPKVVIEMHPDRIGRATLRIAFNPVAWLVAAPGEDDGFHETLTATIWLQRWAGAAAKGTLDALADSHVHDLTDEQWAAVHPALPTAAFKWNGKDVALQPRAVANAVAFKMKTQVSFGRLPASFGDRAVMAKAVKRFAYHGGVEAFLARMTVVDPDWVNSLSPNIVDSFWKYRSRVIPARFDRSFRATEHAGRHLLDHQWSMVKGVMNARICDPESHKRVAAGIDPRRVLDGMLHRSRTGVVWHLNPFAEGDGPGLLRAAERTVYHGGWDAAVAIWREKAPEVLVDVDATVLDATKRSKHYLRTITAGGAENTNRDWSVMNDDQWDAIQATVMRATGSRDAPALRRSVDAMLWAMHHGAPLSSAPPRFGKWRAISGRQRRWQHSGTWDRILDDLAQAARLVADGSPGRRAR